MTRSSIQLLGFHKRSDVILYSMTEPERRDQPDRQVIRVMNFIRNPPDFQLPKVILGRMETKELKEGKSSTTTTAVVLKFSMSLAALALLEHEFEIYSLQLASLQGSVVPKCYGLFKGTFGKLTLGCLILENCKETPLTFLRNRDNTPVDENEDKAEYIRKFMYGLCRIHEAGIMLNHRSGQRHSVPQGRDPRIIDFSRASIHACPGACPAPLPDERSAKVRLLNCDGKLGCRELIDMERDSACVAKEIADSKNMAGQVSRFSFDDHMQSNQFAIDLV